MQSKIHSNGWWNTLFDDLHWKYCVHQDTESYHDKWDTLQNTICKNKIVMVKYNSQDMINYHYHWGFKYHILVYKMFWRTDYRSFLVCIWNIVAPYLMLYIESWQRKIHSNRRWKTLFDALHRVMVEKNSFR